MKMRSNIFNKFTSFSKIISDKNPNENNLWKRNLVFISLAQFMTMIAMSSLIPFMPFYIRELGITDLSDAKLWSGLVFAGPYFLSIIAAPIWGSVGDKYGRKIMIARAVFGLTIAVFLMGFVQTAGQLLALRIFQGAVSGMIAAALSFVSANTPENRSGWAIGILQGSLSAGQVVGPFIGGIISDAIGIRSVFFIVSGFIFVSGFLVLIFVKENKITSSGQQCCRVCQKPQICLPAPHDIGHTFVDFPLPVGNIFHKSCFPVFCRRAWSPEKSIIHCYWFAFRDNRLFQHFICFLLGQEKRQARFPGCIDAGIIFCRGADDFAPGGTIISLPVSDKGSNRDIFPRADTYALHGA
jgi:hypothetical protein